MSPRIIKLLVGIILIYGFGWLTHRKSNLKVPKFVTIICGKKSNMLNPSGIALQLIAIIYLIAAIIGVVKGQEDLINYYGTGGTFLACIIFLIISGAFAIKKFFHR